MKKILAFILPMLFAAGVAFAGPPNPGPSTIYGGGGNVSATASTSRVAFTKAAATYPVITLVNRGNADAYCAFGDVTVTATTSSMLVPAGLSFPVYVGTDPTYIACITALNSTTVAFYQANGPLTISGGSGGGSSTTALFGSNYAIQTVAINPNTGNPYLPTDAALIQAPNASTLTEADVSVTGTATLVFSSSASAKYRSIQNIDATTEVFCGDSIVTAGTGRPLAVASSATTVGGEWTLAPSMFTGALYCITTSATAHIRAQAW